MPSTVLFLVVFAWLFSGLLALCIAKYHFTEIDHFHNTLEYHEAFNTTNHIKFGLFALLLGPIAPVIYSALALRSNAHIRKNAPGHYFGVALTKNIRFPNYHRSS